MTASKSKILAIAMIVAVALFLAVFAIFASSFTKKEEPAAEPSPSPTAAAQRAICFIGADLSDATQYDLAKKIGFLIGDMSGYTYKLYDAQGSAAKQAELMDEAAATEPSYLIIDMIPDANDTVADKLMKLTNAGVINVNGDVAVVGADGICSIVYDMREAARLSEANGGCEITADAAMLAAVTDGTAPAIVYLENAELARTIASAISEAGGGAKLTGGTLSPRLVTGR